MFSINSQIEGQSAYVNSGHSQYETRPIALFIDGDSVRISDPMLNYIQGAISPTSEAIVQDSIWIEYAGNRYKGKLTDSLLIWEAGRMLGDTMFLSSELGFAVRPQLENLHHTYRNESVQFQSIENGDTFSIAGTLTIPKSEGVFPAIILVTGSGPQDRNSAMMGHQSFKLIADYMSSDELQGNIITLRYDERGVGKSEGNFSEATTETFARDATAAVAYLKTRYDIVDTSSVGIIGHSEGAIIGAMLGASEVTDFQILVGAAAAGMDNILIDQAMAMYRDTRAPQDMMYHDSIFRKKWFAYAQTDYEKDNIYRDMMPLLDSLYGEVDSSGLAHLPSKQMYYVSVAQILYNPWFVHILGIEPMEYLKKIETPTFVIFGEKDFQVSPALNQQYAEEGLSHLGEDKKKITIYPDLNHLMQHSQSGMLSEYMFISETFSEEVLGDIKEWILGLE